MGEQSTLLHLYRPTSCKVHFFSPFKSSSQKSRLYSASDSSLSNTYLGYR